jgi:hypothetical protein
MIAEDQRAIESITLIRDQTNDVEWRLLRLKHQVEYLICLVGFNLILTIAILLFVLARA